MRNIVIPQKILLVGFAEIENRIPLGIPYIYSFLESKGEKVSSSFLNPHFPDIQNLCTIIESESPTIIGVELNTELRIQAYKVIEAINHSYPKIKILVGGFHATTMYQQILTKYPYLICVLGEGEETINAVIHSFAHTESLHTVRGLAFMKSGTIVKTPARPLIQNLDTLPFPKHSLFIDTARTTTSILTARGCPFRCSFCCHKAISQQKIRFRSIANIIAELEYIKQQHPQIHTINITDDTFLIDNDRAMFFCDEIIKKKLSFKFYGFARFTPLSEQLLYKLKQAGFLSLGFGLESANDTIRRNIHKQIDKEDVLRAVSLCQKTQMNIQILLIVGLPGETWQTIRETGRFVQKLQKMLYWTYSGESPFWPAIAYPGTELYEKMKAAGKVDDAVWLTSKNQVYFTLEHSEEILLKMHKELLYYVAADKFFTLKGFFRQIPVILGSQNPRWLIKHIVYQSALARNVYTNLPKPIKSILRKGVSHVFRK